MSSKKECEDRKIIKKSNRLPRTIGVFSGTMLNMGSNIGSGVFLLQGVMLKDVGSPGLVIVLFICGGILSLLGTMAFVELGLMMPISGGPKEYLAAAFPRPRGFIAFVWSHVWIWIMMVFYNLMIAWTSCSCSNGCSHVFGPSTLG
jgi:amino acid transporter